MDNTLQELIRVGENCLTLNVWTLELDAAGRPVMVWIPGEMFEAHALDATPFYDGSQFVRDGGLYGPDPVLRQVISGSANVCATTERGRRMNS